MSTGQKKQLPFNSPLETGIRSVSLLVPAYPKEFDLQRLVALDHLIVHTGDIGGPESLHLKLPMSSAEILVRRHIVERGLMLMSSRGLVDRNMDETGIIYRAGEFAETFLASLSSPYLAALRQRGEWVIRNFGDMDDEKFRETVNSLFDRWIEEFQVIYKSLAGGA
mgnify:CR=1 FL=1